MSEKHKNKKNRLTDFQRYHRNELSGKERNSFERKLQKDPFAEEAAEGFAPMAHEDVFKDISDLQKRIKTRTKPGRKFPVYRIAASLASLMAITTIYFYVSRNKPVKTLADNSVQSKQMEITESQPLKQPPAISEIHSEKKPDYRKIPESESQQKIHTEASKNMVTADNLESDEAFKEDTTSELISNQANSNFKSQQIAPVSNLARDSLSEVVVVGYGVNKKEAKEEVNSEKHTPATPVIGKSDFDKYIRNNLHRPDSTTSGQRVVVVVSFLVKTNGSIDSIRIVRSPGQSFSDEAIRIIKSGPQWKPAEENGKPVEDVVRLRLVFN